MAGKHKVARVCVRTGMRVCACARGYVSVRTCHFFVCFLVRHACVCVKGVCVCMCRVLFVLFCADVCLCVFVCGRDCVCVCMCIRTPCVCVCVCVCVCMCVWTDRVRGARVTVTYSSRRPILSKRSASHTHAVRAVGQNRSKDKSPTCCPTHARVVCTQRSACVPAPHTCVATSWCTNNGTAPPSPSPAPPLSSFTRPSPDQRP